ncbi:hypothetical protein BCCR75502_05091 [Burkholderia sola]|nr:hypothetical protein BCCR75389_05067 [Burkholderia cenocepacia]CAG2340279.1 hypothetical protein BCCR75384_05091 [Burkholderia cenocepacia]CAG2340282.1 hypothetical protein BCCR75388_05092 [Burkholderia cenocepacia]CAG2340386.1 hypothetical protein BCCR12632_05094 [Burkholderia cenocepacia]CAG2340394.1 hypothetical protein BCCR75386_05088 [Burkholderia cenocepacia]
MIVRPREHWLWMLDAHLDKLVAMVSGCERIASTPIPFSYDVLLPFGLVDSIGAATLFVTVFVAYTLIALDAMTRQIERTLLELNREPLPAEVTPGPSYRLT